MNIPAFFAYKYIKLVQGSCYMSEDRTFKMPIVTAIGHKEIHIDNFRNIIEYDCCQISLTTRCGVVTIQGKNLEIMYYDQEEIAMKGMIGAIIFK